MGKTNESYGVFLLRCLSQTEIGAVDKLEVFLHGVKLEGG